MTKYKIEEYKNQDGEMFYKVIYRQTGLWRILGWRYLMNYADTKNGTDASAIFDTPQDAESAIKEEQSLIEEGRRLTYKKINEYEV
jgi:hypothetical protein